MNANRAKGASDVLERLFHLRQEGTTAGREVVAGLTTFLTMAYIVFVNPMILADAGIDPGAAFVATCVAAAIGSAIMGAAANYPIALAPGMGLNAFFSYGVVQGMGYPWQVALGAVFLSGLIFTVLSILPVREWLIDAIPPSLKVAISAGIGLLLGLIALKNAGVVVDHPVTLVTLGDLTRPAPLLAGAGFVCAIGLSARRVPGAVLVTILGVTGVAVALDLTPVKGIMAPPPSLAPTFMQLDVSGALDAGLVAVVFAFLFVDLFDTAGTLIGVGHRAGLLDESGRLRRLRPALLADSTATVAGAMLGTSTTTSYIESAAGINAGGRTGLTAVIVALLFIAALGFAPLAQTVPPYATAPALLYVACLMAQGLAELDWDDLTESAPAVVAALAMPLTFSIADGIGLGFVTYAAIKVATGRVRELSFAVVVIAGLFIAKFALL